MIDKKKKTKKKNEKIVRYSRKRPFPLGSIIFLVIISYIIFGFYRYLTSNPVSGYEVHQGTIASNHIYRGLIIRQEQVITAEESGKINYYTRSAQKASTTDLVYSIDTNGILADEITNAGQNGQTYDRQALSMISNKIDAFTSSYSPEEFYQVHTFKKDFASELLQTMNFQSLETLSEKISSAENNGTFFRYMPPVSGIVLYYTDQYESKTIDDFTVEDFDPKTYEKTNLFENIQIKTGDPAYKLVTSENWNMVVPVPQATAELLATEKKLKIRFCKDDQTALSDCQIQNKDGQNFLILSFQDSLVRYAYERFMNIELLFEERSGLKIPNTAMIEKEFFEIPKTFVASDGETLYLKQMRDGKESIVAITPDLYEKDPESDTFCILDSSLKKGDLIQKENSLETFTLLDTQTLPGVYNINKGYAVFRLVAPIYQNDEYTIIKQGVRFGISLYDHIALDAGSVEDKQLIWE